MRSEDHDLVGFFRSPDLAHRVVRLKRVARERILDVRLDAHRLAAAQQTLELRVDIVADHDLRHRRHTGRASGHREQAVLHSGPPAARLEGQQKS